MSATEWEEVAVLIDVVVMQDEVMQKLHSSGLYSAIDRIEIYVHGGLYPFILF